MAKEFVRNIKETKLRGKNIEPLYTNEQNDLLSDKEHAYIRNNDWYFPLTQAILDVVAKNDDSKNPVIPKLNIDGRQNQLTLEWDTKSLGNNFVERTPITIIVDDEFNQIKIGIDQEALYRFIKPYFQSTKDITVDFDDENQTISYRLNDDAFFERLVSHLTDGNGLDLVVDDEFKTIHYDLKDDKVKSIIFDTVVAKDDGIIVEQNDGKLTIDLSDKYETAIKDLQRDKDVIDQNVNYVLSLTKENKDRIQETNDHLQETNDSLQETNDSFHQFEVDTESNIGYAYQYIQEIGDEIQKLKQNSDTLALLRPVIDKYHFKTVTKRPNFFENYEEQFPSNEMPAVYELNIPMEPMRFIGESRPSDDPYVLGEDYLFFVYQDQTYILDRKRHSGNLSRWQVNKYAKPLKNLNVEPNGNDFTVNFDLSQPETIIYDLYTMNSLD